MAFSAESGYTNLSQGNFSPTLFSKKAQIKFRKVSVVQDITNTDYFGEIANYGDTVKIIVEPDITISDLHRGTNLATQMLDDSQLILTVDQGKYFQFAVDDIEAQQSHVNWEALASDRAGYKLTDTFDSNVLTYITTTLLTANTIGTTGSPQAVNYGGSALTPLALLNRLKRILNVANIPQEDRWLVVDPYFMELLEDEASKLINRDYNQSTDLLRNGKVATQQVRGFTLYQSNNLPTGGTGPSATSGSNYGYLLAGHKSAVATAEQLKNVEKFRSQTAFADIVRGKHVFGRKTLRTDALVGAIWHS